VKTTKKEKKKSEPLPYMIQGVGGGTVIAVLSVFIYSSLRLALPMVVESFIDALTKGVSWTERLGSLAVLYAILGIGQIACLVLKNYLIRKEAWRLTDRVRVQLLMLVLQNGQEYFNKTSFGEILERLDGDIDIIQSFISETVVPMLVNAITMIGVITVFFIRQPILGAVFFCLCIIIFSTIYFVQKKQSSCISEEREATERVTSFWSEILSLLKEIHTMRAHGGVFSRMDALFEALRDKRMKRQRFLYRVWGVTLISLHIVTVVALLVSGTLFFIGATSLGLVYLAYSYSNMLRGPMEQMQMYIQSITVVGKSYRRLADMYEFEDGISPGYQNFPDAELCVRVSHICFRYGEKTALNDINFEIREGEKLGIFGDSGSGKSTLAKLLCKQYALEHGDIFVCGIRIQDIQTADLRENVAYITAGDYIFTATLKENLDIWNERPMTEVAQIIRDFHLQEFLGIETNADLMQCLSKKLDPDKMSIGEKQLLHICRLFFHNKRIIILDEAAASIDPEIENKLVAVYERQKGAAFVLITHNVERLAVCNKVLVLKEGNIVESGLVSELWNNNQSFFHKQAALRWGDE